MSSLIFDVAMTVKVVVTARRWGIVGGRPSRCRLGAELQFVFSMGAVLTSHSIGLSPLRGRQY